MQQVKPLVSLQKKVDKKKKLYQKKSSFSLFLEINDWNIRSEIEEIFTGLDQ